MEQPFAIPQLPGDGDTVRYRARPRPEPMFKTVLDPKVLFGGGNEGRCDVVTRVRPGAEEGEVALELDVSQQLGALRIEDRFTCARIGGGVRSAVLERRAGAGRREEVDFREGPFQWPISTYPEVLLPFVMRGQPRDGQRRSAYAWTSDRFCARVYYEVRAEETVEVPAGKIDTHLVWMYPDLNDWVALGSILTRLAKPLLPRYMIWFERAAPYRVVRYEGAYGPPGAPEIVLEML
jgi:hypothetical protein